MFENEWFPRAYAIGIAWDEFWCLNPRKISLMIKGYNEKEKAEIDKQNKLFHLQGQYFAEAIMCTVGNMLSEKTAKKHTYPKKPYDIFNEPTEMTEEQLKLQRELFVTKLMIMKTNYELNHKDS